MAVEEMPKINVKFWPLVIVITGNPLATPGRQLCECGNIPLFRQQVLRLQHRTLAAVVHTDDQVDTPKLAHFEMRKAAVALNFQFVDHLVPNSLQALYHTASELTSLAP